MPAPPDARPSTPDGVPVLPTAAALAHHGLAPDVGRPRWHPSMGPRPVLRRPQLVGTSPDDHDLPPAAS